MNRAMPLGIRSRIATAAAVGALAAISTLSAPAQAFAAQIPLNNPTKPSFQTHTNIPASSDQPRRAQLLLPVSYQGGSDDNNGGLNGYEDGYLDY